MDGDDQQMQSKHDMYHISGEVAFEKSGEEEGSLILQKDFVSHENPVGNWIRGMYPLIRHERLPVPTPFRQDSKVGGGLSSSFVIALC